MSTQAVNGRSFEWSIGLAFYEFSGGRIADSGFSEIALNAFNAISESRQNSLLSAARVAVNHIFEKESLLFNPSSKTSILFNSDSNGSRGDPRDVLIKVDDRVIGISCKHNHQALKHSRLSGTCDFVKKWGLDARGCSSNYWDKVKPIFGELATLKKESNGHMKWDSIPNKGERYYWPILDAWAEEILRLCQISTEKEADVCKNLLAYLIGRVDFYKVIYEGNNSQVILQAYNFNNTLRSKQSKYPTNIISINNINGGQYSKTINFNAGYSINFRIHSASSKIEPSLKFDINAIGLPVNNVYQQNLAF
jgi:hypothetical protein